MERQLETTVIIARDKYYLSFCPLLVSLTTFCSSRPVQGAASAAGCTYLSRFRAAPVSLRPPTAAMEQRPILREFLSTLTFMLLRALHNCFQSLIWCLNGTSATYKTKRGQLEDLGAQLLTVWRKHAFDPHEMMNTPQNFIMHHHSFVHPSYVLKDEVSFYCLTDTDAYFVEAPSGLEVWKNSVNPFHKAGQFENAVYVIRMPLEAFYTLADELGPIQETLIFVEFIPRSGSTLLCRLFEETGECVSFSEAHAVNDMFNSHMSETDPQGTKKSLQAQVRLLCKPRSQPTRAFMFKMLPSQLQNKYMRRYLQEIFPQAKFLFLYRNGAPMAKSLQRMMLQVNAVRLLDSLRVVPALWKKLRIWFACIGHKFDPEVMDILKKTKYIEHVTCGLFWILAIEKQQKDLDTPAIKYEDLISHPEESVRSILRYCDLPEDLVPKAMQAFVGDSQGDLGLSWNQLIEIGWATKEMATTAPEAIQELNSIAKYYQVPLLTDNCILANTITSLEDPNNNIATVKDLNCVDGNNNSLVTLHL